MVGHVLNDRYELWSLLGRGGTAEVWRGFDHKLGREVAVKVIDRAVLPDRSSLPARFDQEARTAARLVHPNIVAVHDAGADRDLAYLVMELVPGRSLADRLTEGPMGVAEAVDVAIQACAALETAEAAGVVHRDVKPGNILLTGSGRVKVCDFGLARVSGTSHGELTGASQMIGTTAYMAPEQVTGSTVDARTDLYGLGCVLYAMLTGRPPFTGGRPIEIAWRHLEHDPVPASALREGIPDPLDRLLLTMLAKYPADRPDGPREVRAALERLTGGPEPRPDAAPGSRTRRRMPVLVAVAVTVGVAAVTTVTVAFRSGGQPGPAGAPVMSAAPAATTAAPAKPVTSVPATSGQARPAPTGTTRAPAVAPRCRSNAGQGVAAGKKSGRAACPKGAEAKGGRRAAE